MKDHIFYARTRMPEFILCVLISFALCTAVFRGFYISEQLQGNHAVTAGALTVLALLCYAGGYSRKSIFAAAGAGIAAAVAVLLLLQSRYDMSDGFRDTESNPYLYVIIMIVTALAVYFLTRTRTGTGILFAAGAFTMAALQFLYETVPLYVVILFLLSCGIMYIFKNYQKNVLASETVKTAFGRTFAISAAVCLVILLVAGGVFYGIVKPLDPPAKELKLITNYKALEVLEKTGIADIHTIFDSDELTDNTDDEEKDSNDTGEESDDSEGDNEARENDARKNRNVPSALDPSKNPLLYAIRYKYNIRPWMVFIPLLLLLVIAAVLLKLYMRKRWLKKTLMKPVNQQITDMYHYYLKRFGRMGIKRRIGETPYEFAENNRNSIQIFRTDASDFGTLTDIFVRAKYGVEEIPEEDHKRYLDFHKMFYKCCMKHLGRFKYILNFFRL